MGSGGGSFRGEMATGGSTSFPTHSKIANEWGLHDRRKHRRIPERVARHNRSPARECWDEAIDEGRESVRTTQGSA